MNEKTTQILDLVKGLTILELADLVKALEEEFGVSAAPVAAAPVAGAAAAAAPVEEKTEFDVILKSAGATSSQLSRLLVKSPALDLRMLRISLRQLPRPSRKALLRTRQRRSLNSLRLLAQKLKLSNFISNKENHGDLLAVVFYSFIEERLLFGSAMRSIT